MSTHRILVVPVRLEPHPNADTLSLVRVDAYRVVVKTADWKGVDRGVYIPPDYVVPDLPCFVFLRSSSGRMSTGRLQDETAPSPCGLEVGWMKGFRVRVKKFLRGQWSQGLLMKTSELGLDTEIESHVDNLDPPTVVEPNVGDDVMERAGIGRYEPPMESQMAGIEGISPPNLVIPVYDVENYYQNHTLLVDGEPLYVTEKIHGTNVRMVYTDGQFFVGSRRRWVVDDPRSPYWRALRGSPALEVWLKNNPDVVLCGEVYGDVQDLTYGKKRGSGDVEVRFFDVIKNGRFLSYPEAFALIGADAQGHDGEIPWVPVIGKVELERTRIVELSGGESLITPGQIREGIVVRPVVPRSDVAVDRVVLKLVSNDYLLRE